MEWHTLPSAARLLFYLQALARFALFWMPVSGVLFFMLWSSWSLTGAATVAATLVVFRLGVAIVMPSLVHGAWAYTLRDTDLLVSRGVIFHSVTAIPATRIQHVDLRQGPFEQWLGLARLQVYTASGMGSDGMIPGLELTVAEGLRDRLVTIEGDDGV